MVWSGQTGESAQVRHVRTALFPLANWASRTAGPLPQFQHSSRRTDFPRSAVVPPPTGIIERMRILPWLALLLLPAHADVRNCLCDIARPETLAARECSLCKAA